MSSALLNNVLGIPAGTGGKEILPAGIKQLQELYPKVQQISKEKVQKISFLEGVFEVLTNKNTYTRGLEIYVIPQKMAKPSKERIQLENMDHLVYPGLYMAGTLAGHRSQYAIACGSGAAVATDILTAWNSGEHTKVHDKLK